MSEILVQARGLGKRYKLYDNPYHRLIEWASFGSTIRHRDFWALELRDVSRWNWHAANAWELSGATAPGKSTLLRLL